MIDKRIFSNIRGGVAIEKEMGEDKMNESFQGAEIDLKAIREAKNLSLKDINQRTRVSIVNLEAIENKQFHLLPAPVYAKAFIKTYAQAIGTDSARLLAVYEQYLESLNADRETLKERQPSTGKTGKAYRLLIWLFSLMIVAGLVVFSLSFHDQSIFDLFESPKIEPAKVKPAVPPQTLTTPPSKSEAPVPLNPDNATRPAQAGALPVEPPRQSDAAPQVLQPPPVPAQKTSQEQKQDRGKTYRLQIEARESTWIQLREDQKPPLQMTMKPGEKLERFASEGFALDIGNAGGIDMTFQGQSMGSPGKRGEVVHLRLP
jgi:cytoskeleton protein RodZ